MMNDSQQRLADAGRVLIAAHQRLQTREKKNARPVAAAADAKLSKGGESHAQRKIRT